MSDIQLNCSGCHGTIKIKRLKLSTFWGKTVKIKCSHCSYLNDVVVNASFMSGKPKNQDDHLKTDVILENSNDTSKAVIPKITIIENEYGVFQTYTLNEGINSIGRLTDNTGTIPKKISIITKDTKMSRLHCQIDVLRKSDGTYRCILSDLGSVNGTHIWVNDKLKKLESIDKIVIYSGDVIGLGFRTKLKLI